MPDTELILTNFSGVYIGTIILRSKGKFPTWLPLMFSTQNFLCISCFLFMSSVRPALLELLHFITLTIQCADNKS
jgi:hypothetical protein